MPTGKLDLKVLAAVNIQDPTLSGGPGTFIVTHVGGERYRSQNQYVRGSEAIFEEEESFVIPEELENVDFQYWIDQGYDQHLFGESRLYLNQVFSDQPFHDLQIFDSYGEFLGLLKVKTNFTQGSLEDFNVDMDQEQTVGSRGLGDMDGSRGLGGGDGGFKLDNLLQLFNSQQGEVQSQDLSRGLFGNKKQQYEKPPPVPGYQGPGQKPGQRKSQTSNIIFGVGGAVAAVGVGVIGYELFRKYYKKGDKKNKPSKYGSQDQQSNYGSDVFSNQGLGQPSMQPSGYPSFTPQHSYEAPPSGYSAAAQNRSQEYSQFGYPTNPGQLSDRDDYQGQKPQIPGAFGNASDYQGTNLIAPSLGMAPAGTGAQQRGFGSDYPQGNSLNLGQAPVQGQRGLNNSQEYNTGYTGNSGYNSGYNNQQGGYGGQGGNFPGI